ncbi:uncharacterized protein N7443_001970 [Penicillium atrosanguineum]|uniref:uncharacterized protein n=1 Tax=Penicillium atrosanguineum TaxID=1132637 RepID=UPI0023941C07|nr:uncharacterized protein N7443_001970 [Penicillium atrosanguineum]KAJ5309509.1 hypothetical protein N7443_001970 [Penicillium atrosanguineum]
MLIGLISCAELCCFAALSAASAAAGIAVAMMVPLEVLLAGEVYTVALHLSVFLVPMDRSC